ncbi:MAG: rhodanese-like domain-containing protein [Gemmatimonadota bacterium]
MRIAAFVLVAVFTAVPLRAQESQPTVFDATLGETESAPEVSTAEMRAIVDGGSAVVFDVRPHLEWAISHIPGARNVAPKPGVPMSLYTSDVAEIERQVGGDKTAAVVLYCNGPFCGKSKRVSADLLAAGWTNVRRYQLGIPFWRALVGLTVIEPDGARHVYANDRTAVWIDAREPEEFASGTIEGARNLPRSKVLEGKDVGEVKAAKDDGRLPMEDHNTRIVVFGRDADQARAVAEAITREAFHNVAYFEGGYTALAAAVAGE